MSAHEILSAGNLEDPIPWEAAPIFRTFIRTARPRLCDLVLKAPGERPCFRTPEGAEIPWTIPKRYPSEVVIAWGYAARFPSGRVESYAWSVGEAPPPSWIEGAAPGELRLVVTPAGYPIPRVIMTVEELKRCALGLPHPPFEGGPHGPPKWIP